MSLRLLFLALIAMLLAACGGQPTRPTIERADRPGEAVSPPPASASWKKPEGPTKFGGGYKDDGPGDGPSVDPDTVPDAVPKAEPLHRFANRPYTALGRDYVPMRELAPYKARGVASWYGRRYHGQKTASGERYDMYAMTGAHPVLPIPSYVRVTNPSNGRAVVVRINDRGPFHAGREIDLSWMAAYKLGYLGEGSTVVDVESLLPGQADTAAAPAAKGAEVVAGGEPEQDPIARLAAMEAGLGSSDVQERRTGHYLQLGAFGNRDNAEALRLRLERELGDLAPKLVIRTSGGLYRVQLGPWQDVARAREAGQRLREEMGMGAVVVQP